MTPQAVSIDNIPGTFIKHEGFYSRYYTFVPKSHKFVVVFDADKNEGRKFSVGDTCEESSDNLTYFGTIVAITEKNVVVQPKYSTKKTRMKHYSFAMLNSDFDFAAIRQRNNRLRQII